MTSFHLIPSIDLVLSRPRVLALIETYGRNQVVAAARAAADALRGDAATIVDAPKTSEQALDWLDDRITSDLRARLLPSLRRVINATGVIVHTNLGRAPLAGAAIERIASVAAGYSNLEYDLDAGGRGRRDVHAERLLAALTGAEAGLVVNNNAAAMLVTLAALAAGREVIVSRGELVEIGGGFRVPDVLAQSGAVLREVGTTNRTRASDYAAAINDRTAMVLRVHPSNFTVEGFTARPSIEELAPIARRHALPLVEDLGSGWLGGFNVSGDALRAEPIVADSLRAGADLVAFSGDKLLGGPQSGLIVGQKALIDRVRVHPLMRAVRADKLAYAALEATLDLWLRGAAQRELPIARMLTMTAEEVDARARALAAALSDIRGIQAEIIDGASTTGGGSAPRSELPTRLVLLRSDSLSADAIQTRLRAGTPPVIARTAEGKVVIDLRTVGDEDADELITALRRAVVLAAIGEGISSQ